MLKIANRASNQCANGQVLLLASRFHMDNLKQERIMHLEKPPDVLFRLMQSFFARVLTKVARAALFRLDERGHAMSLPLS